MISLILDKVQFKSKVSNPIYFEISSLFALSKLGKANKNLDIVIRIKCLVQIFDKNICLLILMHVNAMLMRVKFYAKNKFLKGG